MADNVTNELLLEHMKRMQQQLTTLQGQMTDLSRDVRSMKVHFAGFMESEVAQDGRVADLTLRMERVEHRLELREEN